MVWLVLCCFGSWEVSRLLLVMFNVMVLSGLRVLLVLLVILIVVLVLLLLVSFRYVGLKLVMFCVWVILSVCVCSMCRLFGGVGILLVLCIGVVFIVVGIVCSILLL